MAQPAQSPASSPPRPTNFAYSSEELQALLGNPSLDIVGIVTEVRRSCSIQLLDLGWLGPES